MTRSLSLHFVAKLAVALAAAQTAPGVMAMMMLTPTTTTETTTTQMSSSLPGFGTSEVKYGALLKVFKGCQVLYKVVIDKFGGKPLRGNSVHR